MLALAVALAAPERVAALWLTGCDAAAPQAGGPDLAAGLESDPDAVIEMLAGLVVHPDATAAAATFETMARRIGGAAGAAQARAIATRAEAETRLGALTMPVLLVWGAEDALVPPAVGERLAGLLPDGRFHALPGCGHLPTLEKPADCAALFAPLLRNLPA